MYEVADAAISGFRLRVCLESVCVDQRRISCADVSGLTESKACGKLIKTLMLAVERRRIKVRPLDNVSIGGGDF